MAQKRIPNRNGVLAAIRRAAEKLGRAPSWNELRRLTGVPESRVRVYFSSLAEAVGAAGLEPGRAGLKIATEDLLQDFARVARKLGRPPSRNEYVRLGKYSAGAFYSRYKSWGEVSKAASGVGVAAPPPQLPELPKLPKVTIEKELTEETAGELSRELTRMEDANEPQTQAGSSEHESDKAIAMQWAGAITALPAELAGKRRVTDAFCAMIVGTLLGADSNWQEQLERFLGPGKRSTQPSALSIQPCDSMAASGSHSQTAKSATELLPMNGHTTLARVNGAITSGGLLDGDSDRPVMGPPFYLGALTNAPINELGVVFLFGMMAGDLGFQVQSLRGQYPDCRARRQIQPGKWQDVNVEFEYESLNFLRHGHDPARCNVIVCWRHNWKNCPEHIEVIELSRIFGMQKPVGRAER